MSAMRVVVTGATGNIGSALVPALIAAGHEPVGIARRLPDRSDPRVRWLRIDVSTPEGVTRLRRALDGADAFVHLAWPLQPMRRPAYLHEAGPQTMLACVGAALERGVDRVVHLSSVAAYQAASHGGLVDEEWPLGGAAASTYARHKAEGEQRLARELAARSATERVAVLRPCLVAQRRAAGSMMRCGVPAVLPRAVVSRVPVAPVAAGFRLQMVHAEDVASAVVATIERRAHGAFNIAGDEVVTGWMIADALGARAVHVPSGLLRRVAGGAWHAHLMPLDPTWIDMASRAPHLRTARAREVLDWRPRHPAPDVLRELVAGMSEGAGGGTPALRRRTPVDTLLTQVRHGSVARRAQS